MNIIDHPHFLRVAHATFVEWEGWSGVVRRVRHGGKDRGIDSRGRTSLLLLLLLLLLLDEPFTDGS
jgi:hypothetical protein